MGPRFAPGNRIVNNSDLWWLHDIFVLVAVLAFIVAAVLIARMLIHRAHGPSGSHTPAVAELDLRYARGEVKRDEYLQKRLDLTNAAGSTPLPPPPAAPVDKTA